MRKGIQLREIGHDGSALGEAVMVEALHGFRDIVIEIFCALAEKSHKEGK